MAKEKAIWKELDDKNALMRAVLDKTHKLIVEAALTGFNPHDGDWAERLYRNQGAIHDVLHNKKD